MTCKQLYEIAKNVCFENSGANDFDEFYMSWINVLIAELFDLNNNLRRKNGKHPLESVPFMETPDDYIPFEHQIIMTCMVYGLGEHFYQDDNEHSVSNGYHEKYMQARQQFTVARIVPRKVS